VREKKRGATLKKRKFATQKNRKPVLSINPRVAKKKKKSGLEILEGGNKNH